MIGDVDDIVVRLKRVMPRWFGQDHQETPVLDAVLTGPGAAFALVHQFYRYAKDQTRIATQTGAWLDLSASDFFGGHVRRPQGQSDDRFRAAIQAQLFQPMGTRAALSAALERLTGTPPRIFEPRRAADTGGFDVGGCGYDIAGGWGDECMTAQVFVEVLRPRVDGIPDVSGYDQSFGGLDTASPLEWAPDVDPISVLDAQIYAVINRVRPVGVTVWTRIVANFEELSIVGGGTHFSDTTLYDDGGQNYQPPTVG